MEYEFFMKDKEGNVISKGIGQTFDGKLSNLPEDFRLPRTYGIKNIEENRELYDQIINHIGKTLKLESDKIDGVFETSLEGDEIILKEIV